MNITQAGRFGLLLRSQLSEKTKRVFDIKTVSAPSIKIEVPLTYDLREVKGQYMSTVLNQEQCGSCWAFATCSAISDRIRMITDNKHMGFEVQLNGVSVLNQLSPYILAGCDFCDLSNKDKAYLQNAKQLKSEGKCNEKCDGGSIAYALIYLHENGCISIACNEDKYRGLYTCHSLKNILTMETQRTKGHNCHTFKFGPPILVSLYSDRDLTDVNKLEANEHAIQTDIFLNGSVISGFMIYNNFTSFFHKHPGGVYSSTEGTDQEGGHAIVIVGWGVEDNGTKYWIVRNSWGKDWNNGGYFKILRGVNFCQCESGVYSCIPDKQWLAYTLQFEGDKVAPSIW
jgi:hypothetical protein